MSELSVHKMGLYINFMIRFLLSVETVIEFSDEFTLSFHSLHSFLSMHSSVQFLYSWECYQMLPPSYTSKISAVWLDTQSNNTDNTLYVFYIRIEAIIHASVF